MEVGVELVTERDASSRLQPGPDQVAPGEVASGEVAPGEVAPGQPLDEPQPVRPRRWSRRLVIITSVFLAVCLVSAGLVYGYVRFRLGQLKTVRLPALTGVGKGPMNILLVGSNTRTGLDPGEAAAFGSASEVPGARSDVTMILHLDPTSRSASLLSIPRDLFVPLPRRSISGAYGKIDAALNDGPNNLITAIQDDLGIPINHYVEINFDGFQRTINAIGGISMSFPVPLRDPFSGLRITQTGCQHLDGATALAVVRARHLQYLAFGRWHDDPQSDLARIRRDHTFLRIFATAAKSQAQLTNPLRLNALVGGLTNQVTVDTGLNANTLIALFRRFRHLNPDAVPQTTLPITVVGNYHYAGGSYGDVDMPVEPLDHQVIDGWARLPAGDPPSSTGLQIVNISGRARRAATIAAQMTALGYRVTDTSTAPSPSLTTETLIRYHPGSVTQGLGVLGHLTGSVMMEPDPAVADGTVVIDVGSAVGVVPPAAPAPVATPTTAPRTPTTAKLPTAGSQGPSSSVDQPQPFDPVPC